MKTRFNQIAAITLFSLFFLVGNVNAIETDLGTLNLENNEETLGIEDWMLNDNIWDYKATFTIETETDESLELEAWMTSRKVWKPKRPIHTNPELDGKLAIEKWMIDENIWNK